MNNITPIITPNESDKSKDFIKYGNHPYKNFSHEDERSEISTINLSGVQN